ncbi:hypothetical protein ADK66_03030 [Micromonospora sp. NRRL B-16802]|uniref:hypothetical protein n=1 Tax=Micromonospora sp. NRRL B-16802 TaxID=1415541 RepID=UPI0006AFF135|nr:hypothetical protein [Micromonospora sp. NRRL B-16802]KOX14988.1 hypothetical protein ADK66_03030 [Micromonospora sp. NRRL B-16802]
MPHVRADEEGRVNALGLFHRTISEVENAILQARARQMYRAAGESAEEPADTEEQTFNADHFPVLRSKVKP